MIKTNTLLYKNRTVYQESVLDNQIIGKLLSVDWKHFKVPSKRFLQEGTYTKLKAQNTHHHFRRIK